jgi:hypothetical protein
MTVLRIFTKNSDWRGAVDTLDALFCAGCEPDALVLNTVLGICVGAGKVDLAERLVKDWHAQADTISCNTLCWRDVVIQKVNQQLDRYVFVSHCDVGAQGPTRQGASRPQAAKPGTACTLNTMMVFVIVRLLTCGSDCCSPSKRGPGKLEPIWLRKPLVL